MLPLFFIGEFLLHIPQSVASFFKSGVFLLHIPCWFIFIWGVSLKHPVRRLNFLCGEFLLHIPCCLDFYSRSFLHIPSWRLLFLWRELLLLAHPALPSSSFFLFFFFFFSFYLGSFSYTSLAGFIFIWEVSFTHPMLALFFFGEFLLNIPCWLFFFFFFHLGSFFLCIWCWLLFYLGSFFYSVSHACFIFCLEFLLHVP